MTSIIGSTGCSSAMMSSMQCMRPSREEMSQKFQAQFEQDFGAEALAAIQNKDGTINMDKLDSFMVCQGIDKPSAPPPMTGGHGELSRQGSREIDAEALLEQFKSDFGAEAVSEVTNEDGSLSFEKLMSFLDGKMGQAGRQAPPPLGQMDEGTLLEKLSADFGDEAVAQVTNDDGGINHDKLKSYLDEKMAAGEIPAPSASAAATSNIDLAAVSEIFGNQYGSQSNLLEMLFKSDGGDKESLFSLYA